MVKTVKGHEIDLEAMRKEQGDTIAIGNANMNARGDLLGKGGKVVKTREQLAREYHNKMSKTVKNVPISQPVVEQQTSQKSKSVKHKPLPNDDVYSSELDKQKKK